jgi:hypothetical protein
MRVMSIIINMTQTLTISIFKRFEDENEFKENLSSCILCKISYYLYHKIKIHMCIKVCCSRKIN